MQIIKKNNNFTISVLIIVRFIISYVNHFVLVKSCDTEDWTEINKN